VLHLSLLNNDNSEHAFHPWAGCFLSNNAEQLVSKKKKAPHGVLKSPLEKREMCNPAMPLAG
jgi:hypothetical protein